MQSSSRIYFLLAGIGLLGVFIVWGILFSATPSLDITDTSAVSNTVDVNQQIVPFNENSLAASNIYLNTKFGSPFAIDNFLTNDNVEQYDESVYLIGREEGVNGPLYEIFFYKGGSIGISLLDSNLEFARSRAEQSIRDTLGVSTTRLCSLVVSTTVPGWLSQQLDKDYSGIDFGLSFCPDGIAISSL